MKAQLHVIADADIANVSPQELIAVYLPLVKHVASGIILKCPANIELDDLINVGVIGLMDAAERFSPAYGKPFRFYAELRVRGEILDELRNSDYIPRSTRKKLGLIDKKRQELEQRMGPGVSETEIASSLGIGLEKMFAVTNRAHIASFLSLEDLGIQDEEHRELMEALKGDSLDPDSLMRLREMENTIADAIRALPHREKILISLYYYEDMSLKEIGRVLGVTESRVSQMHTKALARLRRSMMRANLERL